MIRETIYQALFSQVATAAGFNLTSRRLIPVDNVQSTQMPALCQMQMGETVEQKFKETLPKYTMNVDLWIYAMGSDTGIPSSILNPLIDAIETALAPDPITNVQNLGIAGVEHCWVSGKVEMFEGVLNNTIVGIIPVVIVAT